MKCADGKKQLKLAAAIAAALAACAMAFFPAMALDSAKNGVALWADTVLPALLPFFICANFMIGLGVPEAVGRLFSGMFQSMFRVSGRAAFVFMISVTSGYPMGAQLTGELCRQGVIGRDDAKGMLAFCTTSGPLFLLGTVGAGMLHSASAGVAVAAAHYGGAVLNGILWRVLSCRGRNRLKKSQVHCRNEAGGARLARHLESKERFGVGQSLKKSGGNEDLCLVDLMTDSIIKSLKTIGIICCYLILFTMLIDFCHYGGVFGVIEDELLCSGAKGILEMTVGCSSLAAGAESIQMKTAMAAALISFGGLSVAAQSVSGLRGTGIGLGHYLIRKVTHGVLAGVLGWFMGGAILSVPASEAGTFGSVPDCVWEPGYAASLLFSTEAMLITALALGIIVLVERKHR